MDEAEATVKQSDMSWDLQQDCVDCAAHALNVLKLRDQTAIAQFIKKEMDIKYGIRWHCIVGHSFAVYAGHEADGFVYFQMGNLYFAIWRIRKDYESIEVSVSDLKMSQAKKRAAMPNY